MNLNQQSIKNAAIFLGAFSILIVFGCESLNDQKTDSSSESLDYKNTDLMEQNLEPINASELNGIITVFKAPGYLNPKVQGEPIFLSGQGTRVKILDSTSNFYSVLSQGIKLENPSNFRSDCKYRWYKISTLNGDQSWVYGMFVHRILEKDDYSRPLIGQYLCRNSMGDSVFLGMASSLEENMNSEEMQDFSKRTILFLDDRKTDYSDIFMHEIVGDLNPNYDNHFIDYQIGLFGIGSGEGGRARLTKATHNNGTFKLIFENALQDGMSESTVMAYKLEDTPIVESINTIRK